MDSRFSSSLNALAAEEEALMVLVRRWQTLEGRGNELDVYLRYQLIYRAYVDLVFNGYDNQERMEALKRALFIQWYSVAEPAFMSGIIYIGAPIDEFAELDLHRELAILENVQNFILGQAFDSELHWMMDWYYRIYDYYLTIESFPGIAPLIEYLQSIVKMDHWIVTGVDLPELDRLHGRGQMSDYFVSMRKKYP